MVAYQEGWKEEAERIAARLRHLGVDTVTVRSTNRLSAEEKESSNIILLGTVGCALIEDLNRVWDKLGFYIHTADGRLRMLNADGELTAEYRSGAGFIQATQNPWNPSGLGACQNVVWVTGGLDGSGTSNAINTLINRGDDLEYACAVVIAGGEIIKVP